MILVSHSQLLLLATSNRSRQGHREAEENRAEGAPEGPWLKTCEREGGEQTNHELCFCYQVHSTARDLCACSEAKALQDALLSFDITSEEYARYQRCNLANMRMLTSLAAYP